jgi:hypothetical protein
LKFIVKNLLEKELDFQGHSSSPLNPATLLETPLSVKNMYSDLVEKWPFLSKAQVTESLGSGDKVMG